MPIKNLLSSLVILLFILSLSFSPLITRADEEHPQAPDSLIRAPDDPFNVPQGSGLTWQPISLPPMGEVTDISIDPHDPDWIWLVGDAGGVVVSPIYGHLW